MGFGDGEGDGLGDDQGMENRIMKKTQGFGKAKLKNPLLQKTTFLIFNKYDWRGILMENKLIKSWGIILIIIVPLLLSCATTQQMRSDSTGAEFYLNQGMDYGKKGQYDEAISDFTKAIEIDPRSAEAYAKRGWAYSAKNQFDKAISDLNKALEINPKFAGAYAIRGLAYFSKNEIEKAWNDINKAQEMGLKIDTATLDMVRFYRFGKAPDEARLRTRIRDFYIGKGAQDGKTCYKMVPPYIRATISLESFKNGLQIDDEFPKVKIRADLGKVCNCATIQDERGDRLRCVLLVSIIEDKAGGFQGQVLEMWEYIDREWYWGFTGEESDICL